MEALDTEQTMDLTSFLETDHKTLLRASDVAKMLRISLETIYDWKYRAKLRGIPEGMFVKIGRALFVRSDQLKNWLFSRSN